MARKKSLCQSSRTALPFSPKRLRITEFCLDYSMSFWLFWSLKYKCDIQRSSSHETSIKARSSEHLHAKTYSLRTDVLVVSLFPGTSPGLPTFTLSLCQGIKDFISLSHCGQSFYSPPPNIFLTDLDTHGGFSEELLCFAYITSVIGINHIILAQYSLCVSETKFQILVFPLGPRKPLFCVFLPFFKKCVCFYFMYISALSVCKLCVPCTDLWPLVVRGRH